MFRKLHSNRDPNDTLLSEIKKEFGEYFRKAGNFFRALLERYPRSIFRLMLFALTVSAVLSWTVFRPKNRTSNHTPIPARIQPAALNDGLSRIMQVGSALREMIALKKQIDSLTSKRDLSHQDSLALEKALDRLQQINHQQNQKSNGH